MASPSDLQYFFETAGTLNLSRAAERLGMTQPSLSQSIQRLEHSLGEAVFIRHKRGVTLTPAGRQLLAHTRALLQSWEEVKSKTVASMREIRGTFTIGCHPSVARYALIPFMSKVLDHDELEIHLVHDLSRRITEQVIGSEIDIGLVVNPVKHPDLIIQKLYDDEVTFWSLQPSRQESPRKPTTLIFDPNLIQTQTLLKKAEKAGISVQRTMQSSNLEVVASLTSAGCGIGILPTRVANLAPKKLTRISGAPIFKDEIRRRKQQSDSDRDNGTGRWAPEFLKRGDRLKEILHGR
ncbi:MAG: LysR family transcriptional regulator, partial [Proteobacteria bacterium]|nr:LysR family transcriptional regulator [Pseudomonadota bacterium]